MPIRQVTNEVWVRNAHYRKLGDLVNNWRIGTQEEVERINKELQGPNANLLMMSEYQIL